MGWASFWTIFSKTHLVALQPRNVTVRNFFPAQQQANEKMRLFWCRLFLESKFEFTLLFREKAAVSVLAWLLISSAQHRNLRTKRRTF
jgi:hypothetical protein